MFKHLFNKIAHFFSGNLNHKRNYSFWQVQTYLAATYTTSFLMWLYGIVAYYEIPDKTPGIIGLSMAVLHFLSPFLIRMTNSIAVPTHFMLLTGIIHQGTYSYHTGGFKSHILIWFGILPMLAGIILKKTGAFIWLVISSIIALSFFLLELNNYPFPNEISEKGFLIGQISMSFGWIILSGALIYMFNNLMDENQVILEKKNEKIRGLIKVLCHDLSNPLIIIYQRLRLGIKDDQVVIPMDKFSGIEDIIINLKNMIQNIRDFEEITTYKKDIQLHPVSLKNCFEYQAQMFEDQLKEKELELKISTPSNKDIHIMGDDSALKHQVFSNIISNAIKFSQPESEITIDLIESFGEAEIRIRDYGIGIPGYLAEKVFDMDFKTSRKGTLGELGSGFGLPIVAIYVHLFNGSIKINHELEAGGTEFILRFPKI